MESQCTEWTCLMTSFFYVFPAVTEHLAVGIWLLFTYARMEFVVKGYTLNYSYHENTQLLAGHRSVAAIVPNEQKLFIKKLTFCDHRLKYMQVRYKKLHR